MSLAGLPKDAKVAATAVQAGKINNRYDALVSVFDKSAGFDEAATQKLLQKANELRDQIAGLKGVESATVESPFSSATNPETGLVELKRTGFDKVYRDGAFRNSVAIGVNRTDDADAIHFEDKINEFLASKDSDAVISAGFAQGVTEQINSLERNLLEGLLVVVLVSLILISLRAGLVSAISMVLVLAITVGLLQLLGSFNDQLSLNTITLFALVLCLGLIVDDTIIMVEALDSQKRKLKSKTEIVSASLKKVARASSAGTLTTIFAFAPMLFISGVLGKFIWALPVTIIISLSVSLLVSIVFVPQISRRILLGQKKQQKTGPVKRLETRLSSLLATNMTRPGLKKRAAFSLFIAGVFFFGSIRLFMGLPFDIFPSTKDVNSIAINARFTDSESIDDSLRLSEKLNTEVMKSLGDNFVGGAYLNSGSEQSASLIIDLLSFKKRDESSGQLIEKLKTDLGALAGVSVTISQNDAGPPKEEFPFKLRVSSGELANDVASKLVQSDLKRRNGEPFKVTVVRVDSQKDPIRRYNDERYFRLAAAFDGNDTTALTSVTETYVKDNYSSVWGTAIKSDLGNEQSNQDSFKSMQVAFPLLLLAMFVLLVIQFKSFLQPLLIFMAIPFSFFGVALGLTLTNNSLSFFVMIGFFALIGIALNNTILLTDYANQAKLSGLGSKDAMAAALRERLRPLITTSLTSVVALLPLALSDPFWQSLAVTLIFGLLSSTFLVLVSYPYIYLIGEKIRRKM